MRPLWSTSFSIALTAVILLLVLSTPPIQAQKLTCAGCGKPITEGQWVQADGKTYHPEHFTCANCRKPIGRQRYFSKDGKNYDQECYEELFSQKCAYCGEKLIGTFTTVDDKSYHTSCYIDHVAPRCGVCGQVLEGKFVIFEGKRYHEQCYQNNVAITCAYCGGIIEGKYLKDFWGNSYHEVHKDKAKECDFCQRLITPELYKGSRTWSDGRILCGLCAPAAVTDPETAESLLVTVAVKLRLLGIEVDPSVVRLSLVDQNEMNNLARDSQGKTKGFTAYREGSTVFGLIKVHKVDVYLLFGMPRLETISALAHELMHVWQDLHGQTHNDKALCEGSCNYASYLVMRQYSTPESKYILSKMEEDPDRYYGEGYRRVKEYVEMEGISAWLAYLKVNAAAPWQASSDD